jgi:hypothetical protein
MSASASATVSSGPGAGTPLDFPPARGVDRSLPPVIAPILTGPIAPRIISKG